MAIDGFTINALVNNLKDYLPLKIDRIYDPSPYEVLFFVRHHGNKYQLLLSGHSTYNRFHLTNRKYHNPTTPSNFTMNLRKHIDSGLIVDLKQIELDRCVCFTIHSINEMGDALEYKLYVELMGKYANVILVSPENKILHALKLIPPYENTKRIIQIGATFHLTEPITNQINPLTTNHYNESDSLLNQFMGFSKTLEKEFYYRLNHGEDFSSIINELKDSKVLYIYDHDDLPLFHVIELKHLNKTYKILPIFEGFDEIYFAKEEKDRIRKQTGDLYKLTRKELKKLNNKLVKLKDSLDDAKDSDKYKDFGNLIFGNLDKINKGMTKVSLPSYEDNQLIEIALNPLLDGKGNAKKYFQKYNKGKNGLIYISEQINKTENEINYFNELEYQLQSASFIEALEIKKDLIDNGYLKKTTKTNKKNKQEDQVPNYYTINIDNGYILYGKNNLQNEYITWKKANKKDLWFHVKDAPGSHVILIKDKPTEKDIRLAAMIAGYHSDSKDSSSIPINYCMVKELKKIPGGKTGLVSLGSYKTIYIDIDENAIKIDPNYTKP